MEHVIHISYRYPNLYSYSTAITFESLIYTLSYHALSSESLINHPIRIFTLRRKTALENTGITHIVSVLKYDFKDFEDWEKYEHLNIEVDDVEDENLLGEFERTGKWIEEGLKNGKDGKKGGVLVHW